MKRTRSPMMTRAAVGALVLAGVAAWLYRPGAGAPTPERKAAPDTQAMAAPAPASPDLGHAIEPAAPPPNEASVTEQKRRMAAEGEAARIAARENKLAKLDWEAARPGPPDERPLVSKVEAEMKPAERLEQAERMIGRLKDRIDRTESHARRAAQMGEPVSSDAMMVKRLQLRVSQLEDTARELRGPEHADAPPAGVPR